MREITVWGGQTFYDYFNAYASGDKEKILQLTVSNRLYSIKERFQNLDMYTKMFGELHAETIIGMQQTYGMSYGIFRWKTNTKILDSSDHHEERLSTIVEFKPMEKSWEYKIVLSEEVCGFSGFNKVKRRGVLEIQ